MEHSATFLIENLLRRYKTLYHVLKYMRGISRRKNDLLQNLWNTLKCDSINFFNFSVFSCFPRQFFTAHPELLRVLIMTT